MNALVELEANKLADLFSQGDILSIHMFMDTMSISFDVQDVLFTQISALQQPDPIKIAQIIESYGTSLIHEQMRY